MNYYEEECYYDQTPADEIFIEAKNKLEEVLKESIKSDIERIKSIEAKFKFKEEKIKERENAVRSREFAVENKERDLERNFTKEKFSVLFEPLLTSCWEFTYKNAKKEKCDKCDDKRMVTFTNGEEKIKQHCKCDTSIRTYYPIERKYCDLDKISLFKGERRHAKGIRMFVKFNHKEKEDMEYCSYENDSRMIEMEFNDKTKDMATYKLTYNTIEECQKHCDYLNKKEK